VAGESETLALVPDGRLRSIGPGSWAQSRSPVSGLRCGNEIALLCPN
jgi:hypothetical protein